MVSSVKYIAETQEDEKCDVFFGSCEEDVIGYLQGAVHLDLVTACREIIAPTCPYNVDCVLCLSLSA